MRPGYYQHSIGTDDVLNVDGRIHTSSLFRFAAPSLSGTPLLLCLCLLPTAARCRAPLLVARARVGRRGRGFHLPPRSGLLPPQVVQLLPAGRRGRTCSCSWFGTKRLERRRQVGLSPLGWRMTGRTAVAVIACLGTVTSSGSYYRWHSLCWVGMMLDEVPVMRF